MKILARIFALMAVVIGIIFYQIPSENEIRGCIVTKMFEVELCPTSKNYVPLRKISKAMRRAVIASEDSMFYQHKGFDWESIEKSFQENMEKGTIKRGGSTISQQLAKNMFLTPNKTLARKAIEALITWKIEKTLTKDEILERYLNVIEYGDKIYGIKKASQVYFKKHPSEIDVAEAAFLAMLLPNPKKYSASFRKKDLTPFAKRRISTIVNNLYRAKQISAGEYQSAVAKLEDFFGIKPQPMSDDDADFQMFIEEDPQLENGVLNDPPALDHSLAPTEGSPISPEAESHDTPMENEPTPTLDLPPQEEMETPSEPTF